MGKNSRCERWVHCHLDWFRILHTAREKRTNERDRVDYVFIKQEQYEEDVTKVRESFSLSQESIF